jgi:dienelactone hydrolase
MYRYVQGKRPGALAVHEWKGLGDYVKRRTEQLARLGYVAFAADIYGKGIRPNNPKDAAAQSLSPTAANKSSFA